MKYRAIKLIVIFQLVAGGIKAQNLIAVQNGGEPYYYTSLIDAINGAQNGDTIYIPGYIYSIGYMTIDKELHIIGVGHNPDSTLSTGCTFINGNFYLGNGSSSGSFEGIYLNGEIIVGGLSGPSFVSGFLIRRNNIQNLIFLTNNVQIRYNNNSIIENIIRSSITSNTPGCIDVQSNLISNNIIMLSINGLDYNNIIKNNTIIGQSNNTFYYLNGCLLENNIILEINAGSNTVNNCTFRNNLSPYPVSNFNQTGTNLCFNNITESLVDIFINYPSINWTFSYDFDFHLQQESLGINGGTDGTNVDIYGGIFPWKEGGMPFNPHIQYKDIPGATDQNGNLNVNIKVAAQDH
jgi:hypothetical protein